LDSIFLALGGLGGRDGSEVILADAEALLAELGASTSSMHVEVGTIGRPPHRYAYLKLTSPADPQSYAIVSTPGINWFELEVAGGFYTGKADDLATDVEVRAYVEDYLRVAIAYLAGRWSTRKSRWLRVPFVVVQTESGTVKLGLSVREEIKHMLRLGRASSEG
jgi:hypothetical protein